MLRVVAGGYVRSWCDVADAGSLVLCHARAGCGALGLKSSCNRAVACTHVQKAILLGLYRFARAHRCSHRPCDACAAALLKRRLQSFQGHTGRRACLHPEQSARQQGCGANVAPIHMWQPCAVYKAARKYSDP